MKAFMFRALLALQVACVFNASGQIGTLTDQEIADVRKNLNKFAKGRLTLQEVTEPEEKGRNLIAYYLTHTNEVTAMDKLAIGRCYACFGKYSIAGELAKDYVNVYSNDWRGWDLLAGAKMMMKSYDEGILAATNAVKLGSEKNLVGLGGAALETERLDVFESMVAPRLLILKDTEEDLNEKLLMVNLLVVYSLKAKREDVFVKTITGLSIPDILAEPDLKENIEKCCKRFKGDEAKALCDRIAEKEREKASVRPNDK